jgi:hypothetical protein
MYRKQSKHQAGFALLIFLVVMMGLGGIALTGFAQKTIKEVQNERLNHNKQILERAKHALLMYAYRYPDFNARGPGRLPCPYDEVDGYSTGASASEAICNEVGRLPRLTVQLNFEEEAKDATGEYLWYAVSGEFRNIAPRDFGVSTNGDNVVNSNSLGTISIFDQTGALIYAGDTDGVAAVIIAPGSPLSRDENNDGVYEYSQVRGTVAEKEDPRNYLDTFQDIDNSAFLNASIANGDGFILGPVFDNTTNTIVINDDFVIITADEVVAMAEKKTLDAYKDAIADYQSAAKANTAFYPWLNDYVQIANTDIDTYDVDPATSLHAGRIPSIFSEYFADRDSEPVFSEINLIYNLPFSIAEADYLVEFDGAYTAGGNVIGRSNLAFSEVNTGQLVGTSGTTNGGGYTGAVRYFWDEIAAPDGWELCPGPTNSVNDCNQTTPGVFVADPSTDPNLVANRVRKVTLRADLDFDGDTTFQFNYSPLPVINYLSPTSTTHAKINAVFQAGNVTAANGFVHYYYEQDNIYDAGPFNPTETGTIASTTTSPDIFAQFDITIDYFPELPDWAGKNKNNWNSSIMLAYADNFEPDGSGTCNLGTECLDSVLTPNNNIVALLIHASAIPADSAGLEGVFEGQNNVPDEQRNAAPDIFFNASPDSGDDFILILEDI